MFEPSSLTKPYFIRHTISSQFTRFTCTIYCNIADTLNLSPNLCAFLYMVTNLTSTEDTKITPFTCGAQWKWRYEQGMEGYVKSHSCTLGYRPLATRHPRRNGIPRRCLFRTRQASGVSLPLNAHSHSHTLTHTHSQTPTHSHTEAKLERRKWKGVGRKQIGFSYAVYPCSLLMLPWQSCGYLGFLQVEKERWTNW